MQKAVRIHPKDNVAVALMPLVKGETLTLGDVSVTLIEDIEQGHKIALVDIPENTNIIKYGMVIGHTIAPVAAGSHVHVQNIKTNLGSVLEYSYNPERFEQPAAEHRTFQGFVRKDGTVGIRNEIWIIPTVGCVNNIVQKLEMLARPLITGSIDAIHAFTHPYGCSQMGGDQENTRRILGNLIRHPNAGGVLILGLGCENSNIDVLKPYIGDYDPERIRFVVAQKEEDEIAACMAQLEDLVKIVSKDERTECPASKLRVGLKCGGSDGLSGITANPTIGVFSDLLGAMGGTTILTEVPEMFGAETILMDRCADEALFGKTVRLINDFKEYFESYHMPVYENPSPGNKAGGITTLEDKALGCTQKSGSGPVKGVLKYGEKVANPGLNLLSAPGNDLVASTALAVSGAQLVLFSTGRGTPFGCPVPTVKIASNTPLAEKKKNWIDFDAGRLLTGMSLDDLGRDLMDLVLAVAGGQPTRNEINGFHDLAIFKQGVTL